MDSYFRIYFVDFGNTSLLSFQDILELPQKFTELSFKAFHCSLPLKGKLRKDSLEVIEEFFLLTEDKDLDIQVKDIQNNCHIVDLLHNDVSVCQELSKTFGLQFFNNSWSEKVRFKQDAKHIFNIQKLREERGELPIEDPVVWYCGHNRKVVLTAYNDQDLWCIEEKDLGPKQKLCKKIATYYSQIRPENVSIQEGAVYAVCADETWFRAIVLNITTGMDVVVQSIDSGEVYNVPKTKFKILEERFKSRARFARIVRLYNRGVIQNSNIVDHILKKLISTETRLYLRVMDCKERVPYVVLTVKGLDIVEDILAAPQAVSPLSYLIKKFKDVAIDCSLPSELEESIIVHVSHVESVHEFYIQPAAWEEELSEMTYRLNDIYPQQYKFLNLVHAEAGMFCIVKFSEDKCYYRAKVISGGPKKATIQFIDFGNYDEVSVSDLFVLVDGLTSRSLCIKCALNDVNEKSSTEKFINLTKNKALSCKYYQGSDCLIVDLWDQQICINKELSSDYLLSDEEITSIQVQPCSYLIDCSMEKEEMTMLHVDSPEVFFVLPKHREEPRKNLQQELNEMYKGYVTNLPNPSSGKFCVARVYDDDLEGTWFRGKILEVRDDKSRVRLLDEGKVYICYNKNIKILIPSLATKPSCALECRLTIGRKFNQSSTPEEKKELMNLYPPRNDKVYVVCKNMANDQIRVDLYDKNNEKIVIASSTKLSPSDIIEDINIESTCKLNDSEKSSTIKTLSDEDDEPKREISAYTKKKMESFQEYMENYRKSMEQEEENLIQGPIPEHDPIIGEVDALVCSVESPTEFWIHIKDETPKLSEIVEKINSSIEDYEEVEEPDVNAYCLAKSGELNEWHRGRIIDEYTDVVDIFFVDYGILEVVTKNNLRKIPSDITKTPCFAIPATLFSIREPINGWSETQIEDFEKKTYKKSVICKVITATLPLEVILAVDNNVINIDYVRAGRAEEAAIFDETRYEGRISHSTKFGDIYIQLLEDDDDLMKVSRLLKNADNFPIPEKIIKDSMVAVKMAGEWYRAKIKKTGSTNYAYLVDYGQTLIIEKSNIRLVDQDISKIDPLVIRFESYLPSIPREVYDKLMEIDRVEVLLESPRTIFVKNVELSEYLKHNDNEETVTDIQDSESDGTIENISARPSSDTDKETKEDDNEPFESSENDKVVDQRDECKTDSEIDKSSHISNSTTHHVFKSTKLQNTAIEAASNLKVFNSLCSKRGAEITVEIVSAFMPFYFLARLMEIPPEIENLDGSILNNKNVSVNTPCIAKTSKGVWIRVKLLKCRPTRYQAYAIDYGYVFEVNPGDVRSIEKEKYVTIPAQSFVCKLADCGNNIIVHKHLNILKQCIVKLKVEEWMNDEPAEVIIYVKVKNSFRSINAVLIQGQNIELLSHSETDYAEFDFESSIVSSDGYDNCLSDSSF
ncbi:DgyrCDS6672 [Dimorphilus gyrociliatus]|uniref:DgyrCDS6672 n=1 Tax=Dimorphilus gyrociliatus TaxID=2664684 RepID=A0A7I8VPC8_9ANNE|nr:DgyrCDS6672 [Dimorphilus gyrociliatus]